MKVKFILIIFFTLTLTFSNLYSQIKNQNLIQYFKSETLGEKDKNNQNELIVLYKTRQPEQFITAGLDHLKNVSDVKAYQKEKVEDGIFTFTDKILIIISVTLLLLAFYIMRKRKSSKNLTSDIKMTRSFHRK